jgi:hypothetical protein
MITMEMKASIFPNLLFIDDGTHIEVAQGKIVLYYRCI